MLLLDGAWPERQMRTNSCTLLKAVRRPASYSKVTASCTPFGAQGSRFCILLLASLPAHEFDLFEYHSSVLVKLRELHANTRQAIVDMRIVLEQKVSTCLHDVSM